MKFRYLVLGVILWFLFIITSADFFTSTWRSENYKLAQTAIIFISYLTIIFIIYKEIRITLNKYTPNHPTKRPIFDWNYERHFWEGYKKKEYQKKIYRYTLVTSAVIIFILMSIFFFKKDRNSLLLMYLQASMIIIPLVPFTLGVFIENLKNELFEDKYSVQIYKKGIIINDKYFGYDYNWNSGNKIYLTGLEIVNNLATPCLKFTIERLYQGIGDISSRDNTKTKKILIPIPQDEKIDLEWLKSKLVIRKSYYLRN